VAVFIAIHFLEKIIIKNHDLVDRFNKMKKVLNDKILNIENTPLFDNKFLFSYLESDYFSEDIEVFYMSELLKSKENTELLNNLN